MTCRKTDIILELQRITKEAGGENGNVKHAIAKAARRLGLSYRRARSFWYAEQGANPTAAEADQLRALEPELLRERRRRLALEAAAIKQRLAAIERG